MKHLWRLTRGPCEGCWRENDGRDTCVDQPLCSVCPRPAPCPPRQPWTCLHVAPTLFCPPLSLHPCHRVCDLQAGSLLKDVFISSFRVPSSAGDTGGAESLPSELHLGGGPGGKASSLDPLAGNSVTFDSSEQGGTGHKMYRHTWVCS